MKGTKKILCLMLSLVLVGMTGLQYAEQANAIRGAFNRSAGDFDSASGQRC